MVSDTDSFLTARRLAVDEGILAGGSTGTAVWAALQLAPDLRRDDVVVVLIPDSGRGYLSKLYNDEWMADHGFLRTSGHTVAELLERKGARLPGADPRPPERDRPAGDRGHGRVRRLPDRGHPGRAAARGGRGGRCGARARPHAAGGARPGDPRPVGGRGHGAAAAVGRERRDGGPRRAAPGGVAGGDRARQRASGRRHHPVGRARVPGPGRLARGRADEPNRRPTGRRRGQGFSTLAIHAGQEPDPLTGAVVTPIHLASTFAQQAVGEHQGFDYARTGNPTRVSLETTHRLSRRRQPRLRASRAAWPPSTPSCGCSRPGDHLLIPNDAYGGTYRLVASLYAGAGVSFSPVDLRSPDARRGRVARRDPPRLGGDTEQPEAAHHRHRGGRRDRARPRGAAASSTTPSPRPTCSCPSRSAPTPSCTRRPSTSAATPTWSAGLVVTSDEELATHLGFVQNSAGAVPSPFDCYLVQRGLKTLAVRLDRQCANARGRSPSTSRPPGRGRRSTTPASPGTRATSSPARQMLDFGAMVSFTLRGGEPAALKVAGRHAAVHPGRVPRRRRVADRAARAR